jgi:hypothetical protein
MSSPVLSYLLFLQYLAHYAHLMSTRSNLDQVLIDTFQSVYSYDFVHHALVYKSVAKKVRMVPTTMPAEYRVVCQLPANPLASMPELPTHPLNFIPGAHFMCNNADKLDLDPVKWLWPEELKLIQWLVLTHECTFASCTSECRCLEERDFPPYRIPTVPHAPWSQQNIPILPTMVGEVIHIIKEKISLTVEVDVKYTRGMINNLDLQPNTTIN